MQKGFRHNHILKKTITILCVFVMVFYFLPMNVFAKEIREQIQENEEPEEVMTESIEEHMMQVEEKENDYKTKKVLKEETDKRTTNEKHYISNIVIYRKYK